MPDLRGLLGTEGASTIGGVVAANASGPRRMQAGACRDSLIGVRFVDGAGTVVKNGGRVMKNVTGYDLVKLMAGSRGTLGVLSEVAFKVLPMPEAAASLVVPVADAGAAVVAMATAVGSPYEVSGAAWLPGAGVVLRIEGFAASVRYRAGRLAALLARVGAAEVEHDAPAVAARWAAIRDAAPFHGRDGDVWRLSVKPSDAPGVVARVKARGVPRLGRRADLGAGGAGHRAARPHRAFRRPCNAGPRLGRDPRPHRAVPARAGAAGRARPPGFGRSSTRAAYSIRD